MTITSVTLIPAYGRDYPDEAAALAAFHLNKDFIVAAIWPPQRSGTYISKSTLAAYAPDAEVRIRFNKQESLVLVEDTLSQDNSTNP